MLTYENVMNAPLGKLQTAVTDWTAMAASSTRWPRPLATE